MKELLISLITDSPYKYLTWFYCSALIVSIRILGEKGK